MPARCRSKCATNKSIASCNAEDKCSYTNGPKRKFCRLSSKYKMNKPDCNITRKFLKREKEPAAKIQRFLTRKYKSRKTKDVRRLSVDVLPEVELPNSTESVSPSSIDPVFEEKRKTVKNTAETRRIQRVVRKQMKEMKHKPAFKFEDIAPTPPAFAKGPPTEEEIKKITDKAHTRRIQRFMKAVNPHKRRAAYLNGVCSDSGVCIAFGKHTDKIKKHFDHFLEFSQVRSISRIGKPSANGFVKELEYVNEGYKSHAVLKSSASEKGDNLYYEYLVGLVLNDQCKYTPIFVETYGVFSYNSDTEYEDMKDLTATTDALSGIKLELHPRINTSPLTQKKLLNSSCVYSKHYAVLIQHIKGAETISDMCRNNASFVAVELPFVLYQIYHTLYLLSSVFTHNDLHTENVLVYEPVKNGYIQYFYHTKGGSVNAFKSAYIPKIIDYGRCFYDMKQPSTPDSVNNNSKTIRHEVCKLPGCKPLCGFYKGYQWLNPSTTGISAYDANMSQDLRLLKMLRDAHTDFGAEYKKMKTNIVKRNPALNVLLSKVVYNETFFTPEDTTLGSSLFIAKKIHNVVDAYIMLKEMIERPEIIAANESKYARRNKIGEMHVYEDRPLEFISV